MKKPFRYSIICNDTKKVVFETNVEPVTRNLQSWIDTKEPNIKELKITKTAYIDIRYNARLRLYNYVTFKRWGIDIPRYAPFIDSEIGESIPILPF
jgi:hypothetical protein